ncbi:MAG TPA: ATP-binding protein [Bacteroidota bacterium]|nr:ATP-binding protein [Bacteroidota bacterium]
MRNISLRAQVIIVVIVLCVSVLIAGISISAMTRGARDTIIRLNRERLSALTENLGKRYGSVINFIAPEQFADSSLAHRIELKELLLRITHEELTAIPDAGAGFFHSLWNSTVATVEPQTPQNTAVRERPYQRMLSALISTTLEEKTSQWSQFESEGVHFLIVTAPVYARNHLVGVAWAVDDLLDEFAQPLPLTEALTLFLPLTALVGILLAAFIVINLRREVKTIQEGLQAMKRNLSTRLPEARSELGHISSAINELSHTIRTQQEEKEILEREVQQKEKLASLGQLIAGVAHEIRTPLAAIKTRVQLWQRAASRGARSNRRSTRDPVTVESMAMVVQELDRMEKTVQKLLTFSRGHALKLRRVNIHHTLRTSVRLFQNEIRKRRVRVKTQFNANDPIWNVDETELQKVFLNLLSNALEAMPNGGRLTLRTERTNDALTIAFEDTGIGMKPTVAKRVFEPFFTTKDAGTGLGLSIAHEIIRAHGGTLDYQTRPGAGTTFIIRFGGKNAGARTLPQVQ